MEAVAFRVALRGDLKRLFILTIIFNLTLFPNWELLKELIQSGFFLTWFVSNLSAEYLFITSFHFKANLGA